MVYGPALPSAASVMAARRRAHGHHATLGFHGCCCHDRKDSPFHDGSSTCGTCRLTAERNARTRSGARSRSLLARQWPRHAGAVTGSSWEPPGRRGQLQPRNAVRGPTRCSPCISAAFAASQATCQVRSSRLSITIWNGKDIERIDLCPPLFQYVAGSKQGSHETGPSATGTAAIRAAHHCSTWPCFSSVPPWPPSASRSGRGTFPQNTLERVRFRIIVSRKRIPGRLVVPCQRACMAAMGSGRSHSEEGPESLIFAVRRGGKGESTDVVRPRTVEMLPYCGDAVADIPSTSRRDTWK